jgi:hypothetical protein
MLRPLAVALACAAVASAFAPSALPQVHVSSLHPRALRIAIPMHAAHRLCSAGLLFSISFFGHTGSNTDSK